METCHALASRGHDVTLAVRPDTHAPPRDPFAFYGLPRLNGGTGRLTIEVAPVTGPAPARRLGYLTFALGRSFGRTRQDVIFTRDLTLASLLVRVPSAMRAPVAFEGHGLAAEVAAALPDLLSGAPPASSAKLKRLAAREARVWRSADAYVTITAALKAELERRYGARASVAVVPDGARMIPPAALAAAAGPARAQSRFTVGYAGHLYPWKGVDLVIEAVAALPEVHGLIIGGHPEEPDLARVKALAAERHCAPRITFTGLLPPADVAARLQEADVLVLPNPASAISSLSTSPLKLFEYMAAGRPIVASDLPAIREILADDHNAVLVAPGDAGALAGGIRRVQADPALAARIARQARLDVAAYSWAKRAEALEELFLGLPGIRRTRGAGG